MIFQPEDSASIVLIHHEVVAQIDHYRQPNERALEAGGILIGSYRGDHLEIVDCTRPMRRDVRKPFSFDRRDPGHAQIAQKKWTESGRVLTFVGEWHTHPQDAPAPSSTDLATWHALLKRNAAHKLFFYIQGYSSDWGGLGWKDTLRRCRHMEPSSDC